MTWAEFVTLVNTQLSVDADRRGLEDFRAQQMVNAVIDLQRYIEDYRHAQVTVFHESDMSVVGKAQLVALPTYATPTAFYIYSTASSDNAEIQRNRLDLVSWVNRYSLQTGILGDRAYRYALAPAGKQVMIWPPISAAGNTAMLMTWNGYKSTFVGNDLVTFPPEAAQAVSFYVKKEIARTVDKDLGMSQLYTSNYVAERLALWRDAQERHDAEKPDDEFPDGVPAPVIVIGHTSFSDGFSLGFS